MNAPDRDVTRCESTSQAALRLLPAALLAALAGCTDAPRTGRAPADTAFSVGVIDASAAAGGVGAPQASGAVKLKFTGGTPSATTVVARRLASPGAIAVDGDAADWAGIPASVIPLQSPGTRVGLAPEDWYCLYRSRYNLLVDPYTGAPACPTQCDPAAKPADQATASAGCTLPVPAYGQGEGVTWVSQVSVRAAYDDERIYFLLQWADATPDRERRPWSYDPAGAAAWTADRAVEEDRAYLSFDVARSFPVHDTLGCAAACHLNGPVGAPPPGTAPGSLPPAYLAQFTMHTGADSERVDSWTWRAASTDPYGLADDQFWSSQRISGDCDAPATCWTDCLLSPPGPACNGAPGWSWNLASGLPAWLAAGASGDGDPDLSPSYLYLAGQGLPGWDPTFEALAMLSAPTTTPAAAATLPGIVRQAPSAHRDDVRAAGAWKDGAWTVELSRALETRVPDPADSTRTVADPTDAQFPLQ